MVGVRVGALDAWDHVNVDSRTKYCVHNKFMSLCYSWNSNLT